MKPPAPLTSTVPRVWPRSGEAMETALGIVQDYPASQPDTIGSAGLKYGEISMRRLPSLCLGLLLALPLSGQAAEPLAARVQRLEDEKQIHDLLIRYGLLLDSKDF